MELTKPVEKRDFHGALTHHNLNVDDCESNEIETTDPKAEEILSLTESKPSINPSLAAIF